MSDNPEIGQFIDAGGIKTNYHDLGEGEPTVLIHGSGPGVTGFANWAKSLPTLSEKMRVIAPDMLGFGYTETPEGAEYTLENWVKHLVGLLDALNIEKANLVGNSFGGALTLAMAIAHPERVNRIILMGAAGVNFELTEGLDFTWGYTPSVENMKKMLDLFAYSRELVSDDLARMRFEASNRPGVQERFAAMFPAPRQRSIEALASDEDDIRKIQAPALIIHGREDVILPYTNSLKMFELLPNAQLHMIGKCGHWTQIEHTRRFNSMLIDFICDDQ
ncbi:MAG: 2-hydroxy-6-oxo-2,4-heptadienoate hydrolase [Gammaproteobacteria bacterium]|nr:MAG: 2-hydroxy-6-oxo-2,4-heptadienoate hydrolase [Gammaproteobacteria bacterium]RLA15581.1 MAG: 2-hydroxy-6-oxo-2,4-heptadienoate hydrolase [Gammaproteobacteria bacterium]RLA17477.1 MAG: 2-hydroxy-6-oxo-2,4-heptadienoate hydrolase [Gammaproteobacteria bacterium]